MSSHARKILGAITAVGTLGVGTWALGEWQPFAFDWPSRWDPKVADLADYVERHAEFEFEHPVKTRFLADKEFEKLVTENEEDLSDEDRDYYEATGRLLRTFGLAVGEVDLLADQNALNAGGILAYYSPSDREMVIRTNPGDVVDGRLSPALRATVVHELTHALQDQRFGLNRVRERADDMGHEEALTALIEGHALAVEESYVSDNFSDAEREQYEAAMARDETPAMNEAPEVLSAQQFSPYVFGPTFVEALEARGDEAIIDAFFEKQPISLEQTILPSKYFDNDKPEEIELPKGPDGAEAAVSGQISQLDLFLLLASAWDAPEALRLSDMWGNGSYAGFRIGEDDFCAAINLRGETEAETEELSQAFTEWAKSPGLRDASVTDHDEYFTVEACDPGPDAPLEPPTEDDTKQIFWRSGDISYIRRSEPDTNAECVASGVYTEFTVEELQTDERVIARYNELIDECRRD